MFVTSHLLLSEASIHLEK